ncbi:DUF4192 family protein [Rathayibacter sp. VKM Ac-2856]|uniref:DUF4192 family protein n=1 Tax=unclassified Rathayibacter TaxID=2609250 RepID=UPI0015642C51|nr:MULTISPECIES: DUF4192 family protein [unclassified Rathayibacter]NQX06565.1 DUF4192 family protein [Rathayibacter sp. VKM Ac-2858]NQX21732.1 DUF4192 family protein [Rathayibacter sp. VKM Ac-2856]
MTGTDRLTTTRHHPHREPEILRASGLADLLAAVPSMIGVQPDDALVVVPFLGNRAGGGFRFPLPARLRRAEIDQLAGRCVRFAASMPRATAVLAIVYTRQTYADARGVPLLDLGRAVLRRLERTDLGIVDVACVAGDGWGRYTSTVETREPRPLAEIEGSETGILARAAAPEPLDATALAVLPKVSDADRAIAAAIVRHPAAGVRDVVGLVERWLHGPPAPRQEAALIQVLQSPPLRDQTTLQIALGSGSAIEERRRQRDLEVEMARSSRTMDEVVQEQAEAGPTDAHDLASASLMMGTGPCPDLERVEQATARLARAAALAPVSARPPVLTVLAWCWWALGVSTVAARHLEEALRIDPHYSMAKLYWTVFEMRAVPDWAIEAAARALDRAAARP